MRELGCVRIWHKAEWVIALQMSAFGERADIVPISSNVRFFLDETLGGSFCRKYVVSIL
jgi:hypothetical protein